MKRFYNEMMGGHRMTEKELRRLWSTLWDIPVSFTIKEIRNDNRSLLNSLYTNEEFLMLRGLPFLHCLATKTLAKDFEPLVIDEPFSLDLDNLQIAGRYDLVFRRKDRVWVVEWDTEHQLRQNHRHDLKYGVFLKALEQRTGLVAQGVLTDYAVIRQTTIILSRYSEEELAQQMRDVQVIGQSIQQEVTFRRPDSTCAQCPFFIPCLGGVV